MVAAMHDLRECRKTLIRWRASSGPLASTCTTMRGRAGWGCAGLTIEHLEPTTSHARREHERWQRLAAWGDASPESRARTVRTTKALVRSSSQMGHGCGRG